ncbi:MAG: Gfo/Idh/MocA family oxidoreductase [Candidatus Odinarchaeota archaeon]
MSKAFNVIQVGLGPMGKLVTKLILERENVDLVGAVDIDPELVGKNMKDILGHPSDITVSKDLSPLLSEKQVDVVIVATSSLLGKVAPTIKEAADAGSNVISLCEELSYPFLTNPGLTKELDEYARHKGVTVVGTGINPGYLMDLLPIVMTAPCQDVERIHVTRMMNSAKRRGPFQKKIGSGLTTEEFHRKISKKEITGHVGLVESIQMILAALGEKCDEVVEYPPKEVIAKKTIQTSYTTIPEGAVRGLRSTAVGKKNGSDFITLDFFAYAGDHEEYDSILIEGKPRISQKIEGGVHGDVGTAAMVVNLIPHVYYSARKGLLTMKDLPVPCNTKNVWKK